MGFFWGHFGQCFGVRMGCIFKVILETCSKLSETVVMVVAEADGDTYPPSAICQGRTQHCVVFLYHSLGDI